MNTPNEQRYKIFNRNTRIYVLLKYEWKCLSSFWLDLYRKIKQLFIFKTPIILSVQKQSD